MALTTEAAARKDRTTRTTLEHRHFATVAAIIRDMRGNLDLRFSQGEVDRVAEHFAAELRSTNPRFDRKRFLAACK